MVNFPSEIINKIISKLNIDTRRSLGIFVKLKIPEELKLKLDKVCNQQIIYQYINNYQKRGPCYIYTICLTIRKYHKNNKSYIKSYNILHEIYNFGTLYFIYPSLRSRHMSNNNFIDFIDYNQNDDYVDETITYFGYNNGYMIIQEEFTYYRTYSLFVK